MNRARALADLHHYFVMLPSIVDLKSIPIEPDTIQSSRNPSTVGDRQLAAIRRGVRIRERLKAISEHHRRSLSLYHVPPSRHEADRAMGPFWAIIKERRIKGRRPVDARIAAELAFNRALVAYMRAPL